MEFSSSLVRTLRQAGRGQGTTGKPTHSGALCRLLCILCPLSLQQCFAAGIPISMPPSDPELGNSKTTARVPQRQSKNLPQVYMKAELLSPPLHSVRNGLFWAGHDIASRAFGQNNPGRGSYSQASRPGGSCCHRNIEEWLPQPPGSPTGLGPWNSHLLAVPFPERVDSDRAVLRVRDACVCGCFGMSCVYVHTLVKSLL